MALPLADRVAKRVDPMPTFHFCVEENEEEQALGELNDLVQRFVGGVHGTWKKIIVLSGAAEYVMPRSSF